MKTIERFNKVGGSVLESLPVRPGLHQSMIVGQSRGTAPRIKTTVGDTLAHVRTVRWQSTSAWLIIIDYESIEDLYRLRIYLRPNLDQPSLEQTGFYTVTGAEWAAFTHLHRVIEGLWGNLSTVERKEMR